METFTVIQRIRDLQTYGVWVRKDKSMKFLMFQHGSKNQDGASPSKLIFSGGFPCQKVTMIPGPTHAEGGV